MPNSPISGLPAAGALSAADLTVLVQGGVTVQSTVGAFSTFAQTGAPTPWHPFYVSGRFYSNALRIATPVLTVSHTLNTIEYTPLQILQPVNIQSFGLKTGSTNAASGQANVGLYTNVAGAPGTLFQTVATAVAIPATANTNITVTPSGGTFGLFPGSYWLAVQLDTTINMAGDTTSALDIAFGGTTNTAAWFAATSSVIGYTEARTFVSGLPATATPVASSNALTSGIFRVA